jgi:hypothetical protein
MGGHGFAAMACANHSMFSSHTNLLWFCSDFNPKKNIFNIFDKPSMQRSE